ncbi:MAG: NADH-quinone oxidoreductase subunit NuoF [Dethiobacter sp.]|nr:NADH-quinone oxidoreductase subunit NuoF [Dethiobacter sp.]
MSTGVTDIIRSVDDLTRLAEGHRQKLSQQRTRVLVCAGTGCIVSGSLKVYEEFGRVLAQKNLTVDVSLVSEGKAGQVGLVKSGCQGFCQKGPLVRVEPSGILYTGVSPEDVTEIVNTFTDGSVAERLLYKNEDGPACRTQEDIPFYNLQTRQVLTKAGLIDPEEIGEYLAADGYRALAKALLTMTPREVIEEVTLSKLRGRGGAGFPAGAKWNEASHQKNKPKYIVCNADEGDPGAFMDGYLLESDPHSILEGMAIAGYAVGAEHGIVYVRAEYPLATKRIKIAIEQASQIGLLGENILGCGFSFDVEVFVGGGVFVCGESTALISSLEGKVGEPRQKPPHLADRGYLGKPTVINNVETLANVPIIIRGGAEEYNQRGTEKSSGTKIFCLTGKVNNTGLVEVPIGIPLRHIIYNIGGGIKDGKKFKAVQTGGPSGGCLPAEMLEMATDFEELAKAGSMMGSGGMIVMDVETCMVDIARYFLNFLKDESCGMCFSCREGILRMLEIVEDITEGRGTAESLELLMETADMVKSASMCGLGQTAGNPVLSTIKYFADEYRTHIIDKKCPAGVCRELISYTIDAELCTGCRACAGKCPEKAISGNKEEAHIIDGTLCSKCGICLVTCKFDAVLKS